MADQQGRGTANQDLNTAGCVDSPRQRSRAEQVFFGTFAFTTDGLGTSPGNPLSLIQASETPAEASQLSSWFDALWAQLPTETAEKDHFTVMMRDLAASQPPMAIYALILQQLFGVDGRALDEDQIVRPATGIRDTVVWQKLYKFQRDGVVGAIDKLNRLGGCIIADSVGLGKTFEALAIIKYHELRNDRVLVLCPSAFATTGRSTRQTIGGTSSHPTDSTTTS